MPLHFTPEEFAERRRRTCDELAAAGLDGLLMFRQESMYYLTGYDSFGYAFFQCLFLHAAGRLVLLTRLPDLRQAQFTSDIEDIRIWTDEADTSSVGQLREILDEFRCRGSRLGVEYEAYGLTAHLGRQLRAALDGFCTLTDASELIRSLASGEEPGRARLCAPGRRTGRCRLGRSQ